MAGRVGCGGGLGLLEVSAGTVEFERFRPLLTKGARL